MIVKKNSIQQGIMPVSENTNVQFNLMNEMVENNMDTQHVSAEEQMNFATQENPNHEMVEQEQYLQNKEEMKEKPKYVIEEDDLKRALAKYGKGIGSLQPAQVEALMQGQSVFIKGMVSQKDSTKTYNAKLSFYRATVQENGVEKKVVKSKMAFPQEKVCIYPEIYGVKITQEMEKTLRTEGFLAINDTINKSTGTMYKLTVMAIDADINQLVFRHFKDGYKVPSQMQDYKLSADQQKELNNGRKTQIVLGGNTLVTRYNPISGKLGFWSPNQWNAHVEDIKSLPFASKTEVEAQIRKTQEEIQIAQQNKVNQQQAADKSCQQTPGQDFSPAQKELMDRAMNGNQNQSVSQKQQNQVEKVQGICF